MTKWISISSFSLSGAKTNSSRAPKRATILWRLPNFGPKPLELEALYFPSPLVRTLGPFLRRRAWPGRCCLLPSPPIRGPDAPGPGVEGGTAPAPAHLERRPPPLPDAGHDERQRAAGGGGSGGGPRPPGWGTRPEELTARLAASRPATPSAGRGGSGTDAALPPALPDAGHDERRRAVGGGGSGGGPRSPGWGRGRRS